MKIVISEYKVQPRNTLISRIDKLYDEQKANLIKELKIVQSVSLTTCPWTFTSNDSYLTVMEPNIAENWVMENNILCNWKAKDAVLKIAENLQSIASE